MITTKKVGIPEDSLIKNYLPGDYSDTFECAFLSSKDIKADEVLLAFWTTMPGWVNGLFKLRNILVKPFGLSTDGSDYIQDLTDCITGGKPHKSLAIPARSENEIVMSNTDKHLLFYLSVIVGEKENGYKTITVTTLVKFHNLLGRCYFFVIRPFHMIVVKSVIEYVVKKRWSEG